MIFMHTNLYHLIYGDNILYVGICLTEYHLKSDLKCVQYCAPDGLVVYNINKLVLQLMVF